MSDEDVDDDMMRVEVLLLKDSVLPFRKAITSMKDVSIFLTLRPTRKFLEISAVDHFEFTVMYCHLPHECLSKLPDKKVWINIASEELNSLVCTKDAKIFAKGMRVIFYFHPTNASKSFLKFQDAATRRTSHVQQSRSASKIPNTASSILSKEDYVFVTFVSKDLMVMMLSLCVASPIGTITLTSDGKFRLANANIEFDKSLVNAEVFSGENIREICNQTFNFKFTKQIYNNLINCPKQHCLVGFPKNKSAPLIVQILLSGGQNVSGNKPKPKHDPIYEHFLLRPYSPLLPHTHLPNSTQNVLQFKPPMSVD